MRIAPLVRTLLLLPVVACGGTESDYPPGAQGAAGEPEIVRGGADEGSRDANPASADREVLVVFLGTSLTEGLGLANPATEAWPSRIGELADGAGIQVRVVNAGLSGETSAGALRRVDWLMRDPPALLVIETGANDGLRALPLAQMEANLDSILARVRRSAPETRVAIVQMEAPPNLGAPYTEGFRAVYPRVAERWGATLVPFPLDGIAGVPTLNQDDGTHPTAEGHRRMAENAWPVLKTLLREL
ncbi:MAG: arylesterase [Gemmatimonadota bacterium]